MRVLRYLKGTKQKGVNYCKEGSDIVGYCDADWGSDVVDRKSYSGYLFTLGGGAISWRCKK